MATAEALLTSIELCYHRTGCECVCVCVCVCVCGDFASPSSLTKHRLRFRWIKDVTRAIIVIL